MNAMPEERSMRMAYVELTTDTLYHLLKRKRKVFEIEAGLPANARMVSAWPATDFGRVINVLFSSESFEAVPEGAPYPMLDPVEIRTYPKGLSYEDVDYLETIANLLEDAPRKKLSDGAEFVQVSHHVALEISKRLRRIAGNGE